MRWTLFFRVIFFTLPFLFFFRIAFAQNEDRELNTADSLFKQYELGKSHTAYSLIANNHSYSDKSRSTAYRKLAEQTWKFYGNYDSAIKELSFAFAIKRNQPDVFLLQASIQTEAKRFDAALLSAKNAITFSASEQEKNAAGIAYCRALCDSGLHVTLTGRITDNDINQALVILNKSLIMQPGNPEASELLMGTGILMNNGETVLRGWRSYYLVDNESSINEAIRKGYWKLKPVLMAWHGRNLSAEEMTSLAEGFADSKFFNYARYFAEHVKKKDSTAYSHSTTLSDIVAYTDYLDDVKEINNSIYPEVARGRTHYENEYDTLIDAAGKKLWFAISFKPPGQNYNPDTLYDLLNRIYLTEGYIGSTVNYYGMLMGHTVHRELKQIDQYGYQAKFTYKSVDRLFSRDFTSWYGTTNVGGWGDSTTILQVRQAYMSEPFSSLSWITDSSARKQILGEIEKRKAADLAVCTADKYAEPRFLAVYLKYREALKIYDRLKKDSIKGTNVNIAFIAEILRLTIASTVFAHEGRHAIDQLYFPEQFKAMSDDERELRAKYSEIVFSLNPKMACTGSIFGSDLDENTNHGKANKRLRVMIVDWMTTHVSEIKGLDTQIPLLMQFDLLTDQQIIAICQLNDPLAKQKH